MITVFIYLTPPISCSDFWDEPNNTYHLRPPPICTFQNSNPVIISPSAFVNDTWIYINISPISHSMAVPAVSFRINFPNITFSVHFSRLLAYLNLREEALLNVTYLEDQKYHFNPDY